MSSLLLSSLLSWFMLTVEFFSLVFNDAYYSLLLYCPVSDGLCQVISLWCWNCHMICCSIQSSGVGGLTHNTVMLGWPLGWRHCEDEKAYRVFLGKYQHSIYSVLSNWVKFRCRVCDCFGNQGFMAIYQAWHGKFTWSNSVCLSVIMAVFQVNLS